MAVLADDDVVMHGDAERLGRLDDLLRHQNVGARGRRVAGRVVVDKSTISRIPVIFQGPALNLKSKGVAKWYM